MATGHKIKLPKEKMIKDGKVVDRPIKLSPPAKYARDNKRKYRKVFDGGNGGQ